MHNCYIASVTCYSAMLQSVFIEMVKLNTYYYYSIPNLLQCDSDLCLEAQYYVLFNSNVLQCKVVECCCITPCGIYHNHILRAIPWSKSIVSHLLSLRILHHATEKDWCRLWRWAELAHLLAFHLTQLPTTQPWFQILLSLQY